MALAILDHGELIRDVLEVANNIEVGDADPEYVVDKAEEFLEAVRLISALSEEEFDPRVFANFEEVLRRFSGTAAEQHSQGPGRPAFDIPRAVLEHHVLCGLKAKEIANIIGVSVRTILRRMDHNNLRYFQLNALHFLELILTI